MYWFWFFLILGIGMNDERACRIRKCFLWYLDVIRISKVGNGLCILLYVLIVCLLKLFVCICSNSYFMLNILISILRNFFNLLLKWLIFYYLEFCMLYYK